MKLARLVSMPLALACLALGQQQRQTVTPQSDRPTLAQQKMCAEQAKKAFDDYHQQSLYSAEDYPQSDYTSHFDPQNSICYVRIGTVTAGKRGPTNSMIVYDAFERKVFASFVWANTSGKKYSDVKPLECEVHPQQQPTIYCQSSEEFDSLVEKWFGVAK